MKISPAAAVFPIFAMIAGCQQAPQNTANERGSDDVSRASTPVIASALLFAADGTSRGKARATQGSPGMVINVQATGMAPGQYGLHIHSVGKCDAPDFKAAEGHWNPTGAQHGFDNPEGSHKGDLPNLTIGPDGKGIVDFSVAGATAEALLDADGAAIVVHAGPDDLKTDPSGDSGARIACGVLILTAPE